jgi:PAS domain S-box-containing protein
MTFDRWIQFKNKVGELPLKVQTTLFAALIFACGVAALSIYVSAAMEADYEAQEGREQKTAALFAARAIDADIRVRRNALTELAAYVRVLPDYSSKTLQSYLTDKHAISSLFNRDIYILWKDGLRVAEKPARGTLGADYTNTPYFQEVMTGHKAVVRVVLGRFAQKPVLVIAVPVFGTDGEVLGAFCATEVIEGDSFLNFAIQQPGQSGGIAVFAMDQGIYAASTDPSRVLHKWPARGVNPLFDRRIAGYFEPGRVVDSRGTDIISAAAMAEIPNWLVVAYQPTAQTLSPFYAAKTRMFWGAAMMIALVGLLTWLILRNALLPLEHAAHQMRHSNAGPSGFEPLKVEGSAEIRLLLRNFNLLQSELEQRNQLLEAERDQLDALVVERTREMQDLYDQAPCGYHSLDPQGVILQVNRTELQYLGYSQEEFLGKSIYDFLTPESAQKARDIYPNFLLQGFIFDLELAFICKDASTRPFRVDANLVRDAGGNHLYTRSTLTDDRERNQQRQRVLDLYHFLQDVVEQLPFGLLVFDGSHRIVLHNSLLSKLLNLPPDFFDKGEVFHTTLIRFKHDRGDFGDQPLDEIVNAYADSLSKREPLHIERLYTNGRSFAVLGQPLLDDHMVVTYTDTTAQKEAQKLIVRAKEMAESATLSKSQFLANMSHEIRTPMNGILGLAYVLGKMPIGDDAKNLVRRIEQTGRTLQSILNDILDFSKIEANQMALESSPFTLGEVLDSVSTIMLGDPNRPDVDVAISPPPGRLQTLVGDGLRLGQVLINLVGNAIKFTHQGYVRLEVNKLENSDSSVTLRFAVSDSGIGMSEAVMADIFKPFSQADASTTRKYGGTGLGLSISRRLIQMMGGTLEATSRVGQGSEFSFTLTFPFATEAIEIIQQLKYLDLLIADDSAVSRDALKSTALSLGWNPTVVEGGLAAVEQVASRKQAGKEPEVLVLDWKMPDLDGLTVAKTVNETLYGGQGPIIILATAHSREDLLSQPESRYADAVLNKPVSASALFDAVAAALQRRGMLVEQEVKQANTRLQGVKILVVDDSEVNREVARLIFEGEGAKVFTVTDGLSSVKWLDTHHDQVDIVMMDVQMPIMNGIDATRLIRADRRFANLPIVALSAGAFAQDREVAIAAGMNDHITKPMDVERAVALILSLVGDAVALASPHNKDLHGGTVAQSNVARLDVKTSLRIWRSVDRYQAFLRRFMDEYRSKVSAMDSLGDKELAEFVHKLAGAAGSMGLTVVSLSAKAYMLATLDGGDLQGTLSEIKQETAIAWDLITRYLDGNTQPPESAPITTSSTEAMASMLNTLLGILSTDNPDGSAEILRLLAASIDSSQLNALQSAIEKFNFREAERVVQDIAKEFMMPLKGVQL